MSSVEELKIIRLYRAYNTIIQLCHDRGFVIRHPSAVAKGITDPSVYRDDGDNNDDDNDDGGVRDGLDYDWFLRHFVITPEQAIAETARRSGTSGKKSRGKKSAKKDDGGDDNDDDMDADDDDMDADDEEIMKRAAGGEWIAMRNAMRLTCALANPAATTTTSAAADKEKEKKRSKRDKRESNTLMVFFSGAPALTIREVQDCRDKALQKRVRSMIIVANKIAGVVRRDILEMSGRIDPASGQPLLRIQVFEEDGLVSNATRHETLPRHIPLTHAEADKLLAERKLNISQLPRLLYADPIVQYLGLERGNVVKIIRPSKESGDYDMYRQVI